MTLVKKINLVLYKFIWNRHFLAAKAPERINRKIVNTPLKLGGLGMLDVNELDASLKIKLLGRFLETRHPFLRLICSFLNLNCFFNPKCTTDLDPFTVKAYLRKTPLVQYPYANLYGFPKRSSSLGDR